MKKCLKCGAIASPNDHFCQNCGSELVEIIYCEHCGAPIAQGDKFCMSCGASVNPPTVKCPSCGETLPLSTKICSNCGINVQEWFEHKERVGALESQFENALNANDLETAQETIEELRVLKVDENRLNELYIQYDKRFKENEETSATLLSSANQLFADGHYAYAHSKISQYLELKPTSVDGLALREKNQNALFNQYKDKIDNYLSRDNIEAASNTIKEAFSFFPNDNTFRDLERQAKNIAAKKRRKITITIVSITIIAILAIGGACFYFWHSQETCKKEWLRIQDSKEIADFKDFLSRYPQSEFSSKAKERQKYLEEEYKEYTIAIESEDPYAILKFADKYANGKYGLFARQTAEKIIWDLATTKGDVESYKDYMRRFPDGIHREEAEKKIAYQEKLTITEDEEYQVQQVLNNFFYYLERNDEDGLTNTLSGTLTSFLNKKNASKVDAISFMKSVHADDVYGVDFNVNETVIKKTLDKDMQPLYTISFSLDKRIQREDTERETFASYKGNASVNSMNKITSLSLNKTAHY